MRQQPDFFGDDVELVLVYIAKKLKEALAVEALLTDSGLDYLVEPDTYAGGVIFRSQRTGAFFYVAPDDQFRVHTILMSKGYKPAADLS